MRRVALLALAVGTSVALVAPDGAGGQELARVDSLARIGDGQAARQALAAWWDAEGEDADRATVQRALWLEGLLTLRPQEAVGYFRRLTVEFPGGPFTDRALLRLARYAFVQDRMAEAARHYRTLARDHPGTPAALEAAEWLERHQDAVAAAEAEEAQRRAARQEAAEEEAADEEAADAGGAEDAERGDAAAAEGGGEAASGDAGAGEAAGEAARDEETETSRALAGRGGADSVAAGEEPPDTLGREVPFGAGPDEATGDFTVQLGAFSTLDRARTLVDRVRDAGFEPRIVQIPGSDLIRVRVGRFEDAAGATRLYDRVRELGFEATVSGDAAREDVLR